MSKSSPAAYLSPSAPSVAASDEAEEPAWLSRAEATLAATVAAAKEAEAVARMRAQQTALAEAAAASAKERMLAAELARQRAEAAGAAEAEVARHVEAARAAAQAHAEALAAAAEAVEAQAVAEAEAAGWAAQRAQLMRAYQEHVREKRAREAERDHVSFGGLLRDELDFWKVSWNRALAGLGCTCTRSGGRER